MLRRFVFVVVIAACTACPPDRRSLAEPVVTAPGEPTGAPTSALIGPMGGTLSSADGRVTLDVPQGALAEPTTLTMQPITNTAPLGINGLAVRLGPSGQRFTKPSRLTMRPSKDQLGGSALDSLWVVTQTDGRWRPVLKRSIDASGTAITVALSSFSDWGTGRFIDLRLDTSSTVVEPRGTATVRVAGFQSSSEGEYLAPFGFISPENDDDYLAPLTVAEEDLAPLAEPFTNKVLDFEAKEWRLVGEGMLQPDGLGAVYTAPDRVPAQNPVTVSVEIVTVLEKRTEKLLLVKEIRIQKDGLWVEFDGQRYESSTEVPPVFAFDRRPSNSVLGIGYSSAAPWTFNLDLVRPRAGAFTVKGCGPNLVDDHAISFSPRRTFTYDQTYWERSNASGVCVLTETCTQAGVAVTLTDFGDTEGALIGGTFEGTVYEDELKNAQRLGQPCLTSKPYRIRGGFVGRLR